MTFSGKKVVLLLLAGLLSEAVGFVLIKRGLATVPAFSLASITGTGFLSAILHSPLVLLGTAFEALHFGVLMELLSVSDVSFVIPLTSVGYLLTPLSAMVFLGESIPPVRWVGILFVCSGVALVSISDRGKRGSAPPSRQEVPRERVSS